MLHCPLSIISYYCTTTENTTGVIQCSHIYATSTVPLTTTLQKVGAYYDLLEAVKLMCVSLWPKLVQRASDLRLDTILRMLKTPHFSARMNALKVYRKCDLSQQSSTVVKIRHLNVS